MTDEETRPSTERRRRANVPGGRQHVHKLKVSPEEEAMLLLRAERRGMTIPRYVLEAALSPIEAETIDDRRKVMAEVFRAVRMLGAISNNVNQLARHANATGELPAELSATLTAAREAMRRADEALDRIELR